MLGVVDDALKSIGVPVGVQPSYVKLATRGGPGSRIVLACFVRSSTVPSYIAKMPRDPTDAGSVVNEAHHLERVRRENHDPWIEATIPKILFIGLDPPVVIQSFLSGRPSSFLLRGRSGGDLLTSSLAWLRHLHSGQLGQQTQLQERIAEECRLHSGIIRSIAPLPSTDGIGHVVDEAEARILDELRATRSGSCLSKVLHGDFNPFHVLVQHSQVTGVTDWEDSFVGFPAYDYFSYRASLDYLRPNESALRERMQTQTMTALREQQPELDAAALNAMHGTFLLSGLAGYLRRGANSRAIDWWFQKMANYANGKLEFADGC